MNYKPDYDTTIQARTVIERLPTIHRDGIDWDYPFDAPEHRAGRCCSEEAALVWIETLKEHLRICEQPGAFVSNYTGWPRVWHRVLVVCMASCWPYWTPRPTVIVEAILGAERYDWTSLTGAKIKDVEARATA